MPAADSTNEPSSQSPAGAAVVPPLRRRLISAAFWSFAGRAAAIGLFFLTKTVLTRALTKSDLASYNIAGNFSSFMAAVASLGTHQILSRTVRQTLYGPNPEKAQGVINSCTKLLVVGGLLTTIGFYFGMPYFTKDEAQYGLVRDLPWAVAAWAFLSAIYINSSFALQALDDFRAATFVGSRRGGLLTNGMFLLFAMGAWMVGAIDIRTLIYAQLVFSLAAVIVGRFAIRRRLNVFASREARAAAPPGPSAAWYLSESLPYWIALLTTMALDELDATVVARYVGYEGVANYGQMKDLIRLMATPLVMFSASMGPFAAELIAKGEKQKLERIMRASTTIVSIPMLIVFAAYLLAPALVARVAFGPKYADAAPLLRIMTIGQVVFVLMGNSSQVLLMAGRQKVLMVCSAVCLLAYIALAPVLMPRYGTTGAAYLLTAIVGAQAVVQTLICRQKVGIWTVATFSLADLKDAIRAITGRRRRAPAPEFASAPEGSEDL